MQAMQREAAGREIQNMQPKLQQHLQAVRDSAKGALDARWDAIRKTVGSNITADVTNIANTNANAAKLVSKTNIEDFQKIIGNAFGNANWGTLTWRDMQAAYTDLGQTLARGDLPGDLYQGLKLYQQGIGQEMENMVTRAGGSPTVLRSLKADWSAFMRDFVDTSRPMAHGGSPIAHALRNVDAPNLAKVLQRPGGQRAIALLENYKMYGANPELLQQYRELVESYADMPKGGRVMNLPSPKVVAAPKPPLFERPPNVAPYKPPPPTPTRPLEPPEVDIEGVRKQMLSQLKRKAISRGAPIVGGTMLGWLLRNWLSQTAK